MAGETLLQVKNSTGYSWDSNPAKGEGGGGDRYDPHRRPVDDDPYDKYVSLWPDSLCSVCHKILVLCNLYKEL